MGWLMCTEHPINIIEQNIDLMLHIKMACNNDDEEKANFCLSLNIERGYRRIEIREFCIFILLFFLSS